MPHPGRRPCGGRSSACCPDAARQRRPGWSVGVPLIAAAAGLLFTTTRDHRRRHRPAGGPPAPAHPAHRGPAGAGGRERARAARLRAEVGERDRRPWPASDAPIEEQRDRAPRPAGRRPASPRCTGPGRHRRARTTRPSRGDGTLPKGATNDDLVVHQRDVQAVVNALWAGGAEAMTIMNVRVISTSAVRCVGNTLLLHGRVYSPPFKIVAIGDPAALQQALAGSQGVRLFKEAVDHYQLGYSEHVATVTVPAFEDSTALRLGDGACDDAPGRAARDGARPARRADRVPRPGSTGPRRHPAAARPAPGPSRSRPRSPSRARRPAGPPRCRRRASPDPGPGRPPPARARSAPDAPAPAAGAARARHRRRPRPARRRPRQPGPAPRCRPASAPTDGTPRAAARTGRRARAGAGGDRPDGPLADRDSRAGGPAPTGPGTAGHARAVRIAPRTRPRRR